MALFSGISIAIIYYSDVSGGLFPLIILKKTGSKRIPFLSEDYSFYLDEYNRKEKKKISDTKNILLTNGYVISFL